MASKKKASSHQGAREQLESHGQEYPVIPGSPVPVWPERTEPMFFESGKVNPRYFLAERDAIMRFSDQWLNYYGRRWPEEPDYLKGLNETAKQHGVDLKTLTGESITIKDIKTADIAFESLDETLEALEQHLEDLQRQASNILPEAVKERWVRTLNRLRSVRTFCRETTNPDLKGPQRVAYENTATLRSMLYLMRSDLNDKLSPQGLIFTPPHLILSDLVMELSYNYREEFEIDGVIIVIPPRHGKTWLLLGDEVRLLSQYPNDQCGWLHNKHEYAADRVEAIKFFFDPDRPEGRRRAALWPDVQMRKDESKRQGVLQLNTDKFTLEATLEAYGVSTGGQGVTFQRMRADDVIDQKEAMESATRERTNKFMTQTWQSRLTGSKPFEFHVGTRWHRHDILGTMLMQDRKRLANYAYVSVACGGPDDDPPFQPIWPESGRDSNYLRRKYHSLGEVEYALVFQNNPDTKASRKLRSISYFPYQYYRDVMEDDIPREWKKFFSNATYWLVTDPAGKEHERSNKTGLLYIAEGEFEQKLDNDLLVSVHKAVVLKVWDKQASQGTLTEMIAEWDRGNTVDYVLIESTGMDSVGEQLETYYGFEPDRVINRPPGRGNKIQRFGSVSQIIENGNFMLAGEENEFSRLEPIKNMLPLIEQMQQPQTLKDLNLLDCVTLFLKEVRDHFDNISLDHPELQSQRERQRQQNKNRWFKFWQEKEKKQKKTPDSPYTLIDGRRRFNH